jgi:hypothetical protein
MKQVSRANVKKIGNATLRNLINILCTGLVLSGSEILSRDIVVRSVLWPTPQIVIEPNFLTIGM